MAKSFLDIIANRSIGAVRLFSDKKMKIVSTEAQVLRFAQSEDFDSYGQVDEYLQNNVVDNLIFNFSVLEDVEVFLSKDAAGRTRIQGIALSDLLPIEMIIPFSVQNLYEQDLIVSIFLDETDKAIPVIWKITQIKGKYRNRHLVQKRATLSLHRDPLSAEEETIIKQYVSNY